MKDFEVCRTYLTHVTAEHKRLDKLLRQIVALMPNWEETTSGNWREPMLERVSQLRVELAHHFVQEEEGGCMEEAIAQNPLVGRDADRALHEHPGLLRQLDGIIAKLADERAATPEAARQIGQEFRQFAADLHQHEQAERAVLESGFGVSFEAYLDSPTL